MDKGLIGVIGTVILLFLAGFIGEAYAKQKARRQAWKLLGSRRQLDYEIERGAQAQRDSLKTKAKTINSTGVKNA